MCACHLVKANPTQGGVHKIPQYTSLKSCVIHEQMCKNVDVM